MKPRKTILVGARLHILGSNLLSGLQGWHVYQARNVAAARKIIEEQRPNVGLFRVWNAHGSCCPIFDELDTRRVAPMEVAPKPGQAFALVNRT